MTTSQLHIMNALYAAVFVLVAILTRATLRRVVGALAGGAVFAVVALSIIALGEEMKWWHMAITWETLYLTLLWIDLALGAFIYLITWRVARRFGGRGLAAVVTIVAILGPVRDYRVMERMPIWGTYAPGLAPVLAVSVTYILYILVGHGVMRLIAGPAGEDRLARASSSPAATADRTAS